MDMYYDAKRSITWETYIDRLSDDELLEYIRKENLAVYERMICFKADGRLIQITTSYTDEIVERFIALLRDLEIEKIIQ